MEIQLPAKKAIISTEQRYINHTVYTTSINKYVLSTNQYDI